MTRYTFSYIADGDTAIIFHDQITQMQVAVEIDHRKRRLGPNFIWKGQQWPVSENFSEQLIAELDDESRAALMAAFIRGSRNV